MFQFQQFTVDRGERGMVYRDERLVRRLGPGTYWFFDPSRQLSIERCEAPSTSPIKSRQSHQRGQGRRPGSRSSRCCSIDSST